MKRYWRLAGLLLLLLLLAAGCSAEKQDRTPDHWSNEDNESSYTIENDKLLFRLDGETGYFKLTDKQNGTVWTSVPDKAEKDKTADANTKYRMQSTFLLTYTDSKGNNVSYDNYRYAIQNGTFRVVPEDGTLRVDYTVGPYEQTYLVPEVVTVERMEQLMAEMPDESKGVVLRTYRKLNPDKLKKDSLNELLELIPQLADGPVYALSSAAGGAKLKRYQMEELEAAFATIGYTEEDKLADSAERESESTAVRFNVSVLYSLENDALTVRVPEEDIVYPSEHPVTELRLLPYFCAAGDGDDGYLLVPDGGGGQIFFHNGKLTAGGYYANVYGWDEGFERKIRVQETDAAFPVFGIAKNGSSLLAVVGDGAGDLAVEADIAGKSSSYDFVRPVFTVVHGEDTAVSEKSSGTIRVFQSDTPDETLTVRYFCGQSDSYTDMAGRYREYLKSAYPGFGEQVSSGGSVPLVVGMVGAIDKTEKVLGVPSRETYPAATYAETENVLNRLSGISNLRLQYFGVLNGGLDQKALLKTSVVSGLGGKNERASLLDTAERNGVRVYIGACAEQVLNGSGFSAAKHAIRSTTNSVIVRYPYLPNVQTMKENSENKVWLLSLEAQKTAFSALAEEAADWNGAGVSYLDAGDLLYSDFDRKDGTSRDDMRRAQTALLAEQKAACAGVMTSGGNDYAAAESDCVVNLNISGSNYDIVDRQIPFYQIALHGCVDYTGAPLNSVPDWKTELLRSVETGAGLYFVFFESDYQDLLYSRYTVYYNYFSANFADWQDTIAGLYSRFDAELSGVSAQEITAHTYLTDSVTCTQYADGTCVYVNYGSTDAEIDGVTVPAEDWTVRKGE